MKTFDELIKERLDEVHKLTAKANFTPEQEEIVCELLNLSRRPLSGAEYFRQKDDGLKEKLANLDASETEGLMELTGEKKMLDEIRREFV